MAHINLLPWREEAQKAKQREFITILAAIALVVTFVVLMVNQVYQMRIEGQQSRNEFLRVEIAKLDQRIAEIKTLNDKKSELETRISVVEQLQRSRNVGTQVLDSIAKIVPGGVYLTLLKKQGNMLILSGKSESNNHLANMIREIERSDLFEGALLETITSDENKSKLLSDFKMRVRIKGLVGANAPAKVAKAGGR